MKETYDAHSIKIKHTTEDAWSAAVSLAEEFNGNEQLIQRGLEACQLAHVPFSYYINKYLRKLPGIPLNEEVNQIYREQQKRLARK